MRRLSEIDLLVAASRGNLYRLRVNGKWTFCTRPGGETNRKPVLDLMRRGLLEPNKVGLPGVSEDLLPTIRGRQAMASKEVPQR